MKQDAALMKSDLQPFYSPFSGGVLIKADAKDRTIVYLEASNESVDAQDEKLFRKALEDEANSFLKEGVISWDHLHKLEKSPEYIIGEPLDVAFKNDATWVKAKLYPKVAYAKSVMNLLDSNTTRLGSSVGGYIRQKKDVAGTATGILKVLWDEVAITYKPVNKSTLGNVSLIPMGAFAKALAVGSGIDASQFTGGRSLVNESLQGATNNPNMQSLMNELVLRLKSGDIQTAKDVQDFLQQHGALHLYNQIAVLLIKKLNNGGFQHGRN